MDAYTLRNYDSTGEMHLFKGRMTPESKEYKCNTGSISACKKMKSVDADSVKFSCATEQEARDKCAKIGRDVCGTCVSTLYTTYP